MGQLSAPARERAELDAANDPARSRRDASKERGEAGPEAASATRANLNGYILRLQRSAGNRAVAEMLRRRGAQTIQRKGVSDSFGTRDLPGLDEGPGIVPEAEAQRDEATALGGGGDHAAEDGAPPSADETPPAAGAAAAGGAAPAGAAASGAAGRPAETTDGARPATDASLGAAGPLLEEAGPADLATASPAEGVKAAAAGGETGAAGGVGTKGGGVGGAASPTTDTLHGPTGGADAVTPPIDGAQNGTGPAAAGAPGTGPTDEGTAGIAGAGGTPAAVGVEPGAPSDVPAIPTVGGTNGAGAGGLAALAANGGGAGGAAALAGNGTTPALGGLTAGAIPDIELPQENLQRAVTERQPRGPAVQRQAAAALDTSELTQVDTSGIDGRLDGTVDTNAVRGAGNAIGSAPAAGGGGVLDTVLNAAMSAFRSLFDSASTSARSGAGEAAGETQRAHSEAGTDTAAAAAQAQTTVQSETGGIGRMAAAIAAQAGGEARSQTDQTTGGIRGIMRTLAAGIRSRIQAWLRSAGSDDQFIESIIAPVRAFIAARVAALRAFLAGLQARLTAFVTEAAARLTSVFNNIGMFLTIRVQFIRAKLLAAITRISGLITRVIDAVASRARALPSVVSGLVQTLLAGARRVVAAVVAAATYVINGITTLVLAVIARIRARIAALIELIRSAVQRVIDRVFLGLQNLITRIVNAATAVATWIRNRVRAILRGLASAILWVIRNVVERWLRPRIQEAMRQAREAIEAFRRMLPILQQMAEESRRRMVGDLESGVDRMASLGDSAIENVLNPDGDHFAIGGAANFEASAIGGASVGITYTYDFVADYAHNQIGIFYTIGASVGGSVGGDIGAAADVGASMGWGTIMNMQSKRDINDAAGGYNLGVGVGVQAGLAVQGGAVVSFGHTLTMSLDTLDQVVCPQPPQTPQPPVPQPRDGQPPVPPPPGPPPQRPQVERHPLSGWNVFFPTGGSALSGNAGAVIDMAATEARNRRSQQDGALTILVEGHASPRWRRPRRGETAATENDRLSAERAHAVSRELGAKFTEADAPRQLTATGRGTQLAQQAGVGPDTDDQRFRSASISGAVTTVRPAAVTGGGSGAGGAGGGGGGGGGANPQQAAAAQSLGCQVAAQIPLPPGFGEKGIGGGGSLDQWLRARPYGWDTGIYAGAAGGAKAQVALTANIGLSRAFPIKHWNLSAAEMRAVRLLFGLVKLTLDLATASPVSFVRDAIAVAPAVEGIVTDMIANPITNIDIPMPSIA